MSMNSLKMPRGRRLGRSQSPGPAVVAALFMSVVAMTGCAFMRNDQPTVAAPRHEDSPVMRPGLLLDIRVFVAGELEIEQKGKRVGTDGGILLPLIGRVKVEGLTLEKFTDLLRAAYNKRYFVEPYVEIAFATEAGENTVSPWGCVTVLGCVKDSGRVDIPPTQDLRVSRAIQLAGGFDKAAKQSSIQVTRRNGDGTPKRIVVDLHNVGSKGEVEEDIMLQPGDVVFVPESMF